MKSKTRADDGVAEKCPRDLVGIAGVHFVVSELSRRGMIAFATSRNTAAYDVIVTSRDGRRHASLQVKTHNYKAGRFFAPDENKVRTGRSDYYVLVRWLQDERRFEGFMLSGRETYNAVRRHRTKRPSGRLSWPSVRLDRENDELSGVWRAAWDDFRL